MKLTVWFPILLAATALTAAVLTSATYYACEDEIIMLMGPPPGPVSGTVELVAGVKPGVEATKVDFLANGQLVGTSTAAPFSIQWDTTQVQNGQYALQAKAVLADATTAESAAVTVSVANP